MTLHKIICLSFYKDERVIMLDGDISSHKVVCSTAVDEIDIKGACIDVMAIMLKQGEDPENPDKFYSVARKYSSHFYSDDEGNSINRAGVDLDYLLEQYFSSSDEGFLELLDAAALEANDAANNALPVIEPM